MPGALLSCIGASTSMWAAGTPTGQTLHSISWTAAMTPCPKSWGGWRRTYAMGYKSLIVTMEITEAGRAHHCRFNKRHRLEKGVRRLTIRSDGSEHHYCLACAKTFLVKDIDRLRALLAEVEAVI